MRISPINIYNAYSPVYKGVSKFKKSTPEVGPQEIKTAVPYQIVFSGKYLKAVNEVKRALFLTAKENLEVPINKEDGSYTINEETKTKAYYGEPALKFLEKTETFPYETQVVFPRGSSGTIYKDGKEIKVEQNSGILISSGADLKIFPDEHKNAPFILTTEKDYDWFERYNQGSIKYGESEYYSAHAYNAEFSPNFLLDASLKDSKLIKKLGIEIKNVIDWNNLLYFLYDKKDLLEDKQKEKVVFTKNLMDKLWKNDLLEKTFDDHIRFKKRYAPKYEREEILEKKGFTKEEIDTIMPIFSQARNVKIHTKFALMHNASAYGDEVVEKLKKEGLVVDNKKRLDKIYWTKCYGSIGELGITLSKAGFPQEEIDKILPIWKKENTAAYDMSGMKYIDEDIAVYNLDDKINNWTQEKTNWVTSSISIGSTKKDVPEIGASIVQSNKPGWVNMNDIRTGEALHKHPNEEEAKQYEIYMITKGAGALRLIKENEKAKSHKKDPKEDIMILKEGDLAIVEPGVHHCVHSIIGNYEHICVQIPSVFHYGEHFKIPVEDDYMPEEVTKAAKEMLETEAAVEA